MSKLGVQEIKNLAKQIIEESRGGIRFSEIIQKIVDQFPDTSRNTISGTIYNLDIQFPNEVIKPTRGLYLWKANDNYESPSQPPEELKKIKEKDFYIPFADWLKNELDEVTESVEVGGAPFKAKWGTPDVLGVYKPLASNLVKFPIEIISAEIKTDISQPVVAFGQAVAYRLFSHKSYIVMPSSMSEEDKSRLDSLCMLYGIGFVLFDLNPNNPNFSIRVRAQKFLPDMFYVNDLAEKIKSYNPDKFQKLFG